MTAILAPIAIGAAFAAVIVLVRAKKIIEGTQTTPTGASAPEGSLTPQPDDTPIAVEPIPVTPPDVLPPDTTPVASPVPAPQPAPMPVPQPKPVPVTAPKPTPTPAPDPASGCRFKAGQRFWTTGGRPGTVLRVTHTSPGSCRYDVALVDGTRGNFPESSMRTEPLPGPKFKVGDEVYYPTLRMDGYVKRDAQWDTNKGQYRYSVRLGRRGTSTIYEDDLEAR